MTVGRDLCEEQFQGAAGRQKCEKTDVNKIPIGPGITGVRRSSSDRLVASGRAALHCQRCRDASGGSGEVGRQCTGASRRTTTARLESKRRTGVPL